MAAEMGAFHSLNREPDRTIVFNGEIHPYHVLLSKIDVIKSDFVWYLRDSKVNGLIYVDFMKNEKAWSVGHISIIWKYYSIPFGLVKKSWEIIHLDNAKQIKNLTQIDQKNVIQYMHDLLIKLEQFELATLDISPQINQLMQLSKESNLPRNLCLISNKDDLRFTHELRLDPSEEQASNATGVYHSCSANNLDQEAVLRLTKKKTPKKNIILRLLGIN